MHQEVHFGCLTELGKPVNENYTGNDQSVREEANMLPMWVWPCVYRIAKKFDGKKYGGYPL